MNAPMRRTSDGVQFVIAEPGDDAELRRLLRETPMAGRVSVAFAREPSFFAASAIEGPVHQIVVAKDAAGRAVGLCSRSVRPMWVNGARRAVGYLSALRVDPSYRGLPRMLREGFALVRRLHEAGGETPFYLTTIIEDNRPARRILERGLDGFPTYHPLGVLVTLALPTWRRVAVKSPAGVELRSANADDWPQIGACLERNATGAHFRPSWDEQNLALCRDLGAEDFTIALRDGAVVGCAALWDQRGFKQSVVTGYAGALGRFRGLINRVGPLLGIPRLPPPGGALDGAMLSHLAVDGDDPALALALIAACHGRAVGRFGTVTLGLPERSGLTAKVKARFGAMEYRSVIYAAAWADGASDARALDGRVSWPEVAVL